MSERDEEREAQFVEQQIADQKARKEEIIAELNSEIHNYTKVLAERDELAAQLAVMREVLEKWNGAIVRVHPHMEGPTLLMSQTKMRLAAAATNDALAITPPAALEAVRREVWNEAIEACCRDVRERCFCNTGCQDCGSECESLRTLKRNFSQQEEPAE